MDFNNVYKSVHLKEATPEQIAAFRKQGKTDDEIKEIFAEDPTTSEVQLNDLLAKIPLTSTPATATPTPTATPDSTVAPSPAVSANPTTTPTTTTPNSANPTVADGASDVVADKEAKQSQAELDSAIDKSKLSQENKEKYKRLSQKATDIQTTLNDYIKKFKADARITAMLNRYTGAEAKQQAKDAKAAQKLGESTEKLEEAKGGFKYHYKNFLKAAGKVRVWAIIGLALIVAGVATGAGFGIKAISNAIKMAKNNVKAAKLTDETTDTEIPNPETVNNNVGTETVDNTVSTETVDNTNTNTETTSDVAQQDTDVNGGTSNEEVKEEIVDKPVEDVQPVVKLGGKTTAVWVNEQKASGKQIPEIIAAYEADGFSRLGPKFVAAMVAAFGGVALVSTSINPTTKEVIGTDASGKSYKVDTNTYSAAMITPEQKTVEDTKIEQEIEKDPNTAKEVAEEVSDETGGTSGDVTTETSTDTTNTTDAENTEKTMPTKKLPRAQKVREKEKALSVAEWIIETSKKGGKQNNTIRTIEGLKKGGVVFTKHAAQYAWGPKDSTFYNEAGKEIKTPDRSIIDYGNTDILAVKNGNGYTLDPNSATAVHVVYLDNVGNKIIGCHNANDTQFLQTSNGAQGIAPVTIDSIVEGICKADNGQTSTAIGGGTLGGGAAGAIIGTAICPGVGTALGAFFGAMGGLITGGVMKGIFGNADTFCRKVSWASMTPQSRNTLLNWSANHLQASNVKNSISSKEEGEQFEKVAQQAKQLMLQKVNYAGGPGESIKTALANIRVESINQAMDALEM